MAVDALSAEADYLSHPSTIVLFNALPPGSDNDRAGGAGDR